MDQLAPQRILLEYLSSTVAPFFRVSPLPPHASGIIALISLTTCRASLLGFCIRKGLVPADLSVLFGRVRPSDGHLKRICRMLRSETWIQVRLFKDALLLLRFSRDPDDIAVMKLQSLMRLAAQTTEVL